MTTAPEISKEKKAKRRVSAFVILIFATFLIRGGVLFSSLKTFDDDPDDYLRLAENWRSFGVFGTENEATAFRPPLYPWTLKALIPLRRSAEQPTKRGENAKNAANVDVDDSPSGADAGKIGGFRRFFDDRIALSRNASIAFWHWILGIATVAVAFRIGRALGFGEKAAAVGAFFVAVDPILLQQSRLVMTETLAAFFAAVLLWGTLFCVERRDAKGGAVYFAALGAAFGLSTLCRPAFFAFAGLVFLYFAAVESRFATIFRRQANAAQDSASATLAASLGRLATFLFGIAAVVSPWVLRNEREFGRPILTTTHSGYTLYLANNPEIYEHYRAAPLGALWNPNEFHRRRAVDYDAALKGAQIAPLSKDAEIFQNEWTESEAKTAIRNAPKTFLASCGIRIGELWRVLPNDVETLRGSSDAPNAPLKSKNSRSSAARRAVALFYSLELAFAAFGCVALFVSARRKRARSLRAGDASAFDSPLVSPWFVGFLLIASVQIPHLVYWTNMRMRAPLEIFLPFLAVFGAVALGAAATTPFRSPRRGIDEKSATVQ